MKHYTYTFSIKVNPTAALDEFMEYYEPETFTYTDLSSNVPILINVHVKGTESNGIDFEFCHCLDFSDKSFIEEIKNGVTGFRKYIDSVVSAYMKNYQITQIAKQLLNSYRDGDEIKL